MGTAQGTKAYLFAALVALGASALASTARADSIQTHVQMIQAMADGRIFIRLEVTPTCTGTQLLKLSKDHPNFNPILSLVTAALLSKKEIHANYGSDCTVVDVTLVN
jgi:hypothetical protein